MTLLNTKMLLLLWLMPFVVLLFYYAHTKRKAALKHFTGNTKTHSRFYQALFVIIRCVFIIIALAEPTWGIKKEKIGGKSGRAIIFLLDVSRSMLAEDIKPNRLERAKLGISDTLQTLNGDRVALVAFAGTSSILSPLTQDYAFFKQALDEAAPESVGRGGTLIGDALRTIGSYVTDEQEAKYKDIILITDGEDHESFPVEAAAELGKKGLRIFAIGLGNDTEGYRVPDATNQSFITYNGKEVWSKLDSSTLRQIAMATPGGKYLRVATGAADLGEIYKALSNASERELEGKEQETIHKIPRFRSFLIIALICLILAGIIRERKEVEDY